MRRTTPLRGGLLAAAMALLSVGPAQAERTLTLGILAFEPPEVAEDRWQPLIDHLDDELEDVRFEGVIAGYDELDDHLARNELDFVLTNPSHYLRFRSESSLSGALATLVPERQGEAVRGFGGIAFTRAERGDLTTWEDIPGERVAAILEESLGGYQSQALELRSRGLDLDGADLRFTGMPHDRVVEEVMAGEADVGFVRVGILERLWDAGKLERGDVRVIDEQALPGYPFVLSTRLYPEWPFVALNQVGRDISRQVLVALVSLESEDAPARAAGIAGFSVPMDYEPVEMLARELRLPPYDAPQALRWDEFWEVYRLPAMLLTIALAGLVAMAIGLLVANRRRLGAQRQAEASARALEESERHAQALIRALPDTLFRLDADGTFLECHISDEDVLLMPREAFIGHSLRGLFPADYAEQAMAAIHEALDSGEMTRCEYTTHALGQAGHFEAPVVPLDGREVLMIVRDVSDRHALESEQAAARRFRDNLLASLGEGVFGIDTAGRYTFLNPVACRLLGFATEEEALGLNSHATSHHTHPDGTPFPEQDCPIHGVLHSGEAIEAWEDTFWSRTGTSFPVLVYAAPLFDEAGQMEGAVVSFQDISRRKAVEEELARSEAKFRVAQEATGFAIWDWRVAEDTIYWDAECWRMLGESPAVDGIFGGYADWRARLHPDDAEAAEASVQEQLAAGEQFTIEFRMRRADGGWLWIQGRGRVVEWGADGSPHRVMGIHLDIDRLKTVEEELRRSEAELAESQRLAHLGNWVSDFETGTIRWSDEVYRIFGLERDEWGGTEAAFMAAVHPEDRDAVRAAIDATLREPGVPYDIEHRILRPDGTVRTVHQQGEVVFDEHEHPLRMFGTVLDITERRRAEAEREALTEELQRSNAELEQFAYAISHDMRQPLRMVNSYLQLLERSLGASLGDDERRYLEHATDGARRMDAMIVGLLEYSRVGRKTEPPAPLDTREALDTALAFLKPAVEERDAEIRVEGTWPRLVVSRGELVRLFQNLIGNAVKYVPEGTRPVVTVSASVSAGDWEVRIADNGVGVDTEQRDRLFKVFSRLHTREEYEGNGIGLALCRRIVEHHGGSIGVESEGPGCGSTFWFRIPVTEEGEHTGE